MNTPSVGAKDLQDLKGASRVPGVAIAQKLAQTDEPRPKLSDQPSPDTQRFLVASTGSQRLDATARQMIFGALRRFAPSDYVKWIYQYLKYRFGPKHAFLTYENPADGIHALEAGGGEIRLGLAGDWGTGTDEAHRIGQLIEAFDPHYTIHLGDVYFVGDEAEVGQNFLGRSNHETRFTPCRWPLGRKASFALNGNHEMFARGLAYFDQILPAMGEVKNGIAQGQKASFFCLQSDHWCLLGLDTGYNSVGKPVLENIWSPDASLPAQIVSWLAAIQPRLDNRAVIVMTHHQVLSVYDQCFTRQADQIFAVLKRPVLWFWGHEHRLVIYQTMKAQDRAWPAITARCIGHGGMPVDLPGTPKTDRLGEAEFIDTRIYHNDEGLHVGVNGMVLMKIDGPTLNIDYVDVHGHTIFQETFLAEAATPIRHSFTNFQLATA